jgi:hypothetical protein
VYITQLKQQHLTNIFAKDTHTLQRSTSTARHGGIELKLCSYWIYPFMSALQAKKKGPAGQQQQQQQQVDEVQWSSVMHLLLMKS